MTPLAVNVCEWNPVPLSSKAAATDPAGTYLTEDRQGRLLRALKTAGLIDLATETRETGGREQGIRARLTEAGRALAVSPTGAGCGLPGPQSPAGEPTWAFALATKKDVGIVSLSAVPSRATAFPTARIQARWQWTLTDLGRRVAASLTQAGSDEMPREGAEGQSLEVARDDGAGWRLSGD